MTRRVWVVAAAVFAVVAVGLGAVLLAQAGSGLERRKWTVAEVPLEEVRASSGAPVRPVAVVAHGFAGSKRLMEGFGDSLARHGYVVVLLDFSGHGESAELLPLGRQAETDLTLQFDLGVAVDAARGLPGVDRSRLALVGHSMGARAVTAFAARDPQVRATVAFSLPTPDVVQGASPQNLLMLYGGLEFPGFADTARQALSYSSGGDREAIQIAGVEHISILYSAEAHDAMLSWLDSRLGHAADGRPQPTDRLLGAGLMLLGFFAGLYPLAWLFWRGRPEGEEAAQTRPLWQLLAVAFAVVAVAVLLGSWLPTRWLPLAVGNYVTGVALFAGVAMWGLARWIKPGFAEPARPGRGGLLAAVALIGYPMIALVLPMQWGFTNVIPVGDRWWLLPVVWLAFAALGWGARRLAGPSPWRNLAVWGIALAGLTGAAMTGVGPGFMLLVLPLFAVLVLWQAGWAAMLERLGAPGWLIVVVGAWVLALPTATALPLS